MWQPVLRSVEVGEEVAERVEESGEAAAWQGTLGLGETLVGKGERGLVGLHRGIHLLEEVVARHGWETLGGLRMEGLLWVGCLGVEGLGNSSLGMGVKGKRCLLRVGCRLVGSLGWEGGWEAGKVVEGWAGEPGEGPRRRSGRRRP